MLLARPQSVSRALFPDNFIDSKMTKQKESNLHREWGFQVSVNKETESGEISIMGIIVVRSTFLMH